MDTRLLADVLELTYDTCQKKVQKFNKQAASLRANAPEKFVKQASPTKTPTKRKAPGM